MKLGVALPLAGDWATPENQILVAQRAEVFGYYSLWVFQCLKTIWTAEVAEFQGEFYHLPKSIVEPKPVQQPYPPITIGGYGPTVIKRAVTLGGGFNGGNVPLAQVAPLVAQIKGAAHAAGRDPNTLHIVSRGSYVVHDAPQGSGRRPLWGTLAEIRDDVDRYAEAGLTELFLEPNFQPGGAHLDRVLEVMEQLAPKP